MASDDEDENLAKFLESEVLSSLSDQEEDDEVEEQGTGGISDEEMEREEKRMSLGGNISVEEEERQVNSMLAEEGEMSDEEQEREAKRMRVGTGEIIVEEKPTELILSPSSWGLNNGCNHENEEVLRRIETGIFSKVPPELCRHILKFLSSEDLISCSLVCRFLSYAASDESLWKRLYCLRWGLLSPNKKLRECAWKKLYIQRDEDDMVEFVRNCPAEFKEYYIQMQVAKRSQAPLPSQVCDDRMLLDKTVGDQVSSWKKSRGLSDDIVVAGHTCSGVTCTYYQLGDVFVCEKTGQVHVCDDTCREAIADSVNELLVCTVSGRCFDRLLSPSEIEPDADQQQGGTTDEAEPFMGSGRFARAYLLGYNCADEKELEATLRFC
ncbi:hypothetical protein LIER_28123 [Lithospermum erythrorhizon]|uniref:F-box domain-containing protein n=1 Tax=Lithospermum erythrorhizon TaxID=34254 RepID=A0AAV3REH5_LITER